MRRPRSRSEAEAFHAGNRSLLLSGALTSLVLIFITSVASAVLSLATLA